MMKTLLSALLITAGVSTTLRAQTRITSPTYAELQAKVAALEQDNAGLRRDYQTLLTTCTAPPPPAAAPDSSFDEQLARATAAIEQAGRDATTSIEQDRQQREMDDASWIVKDVDFAVTESNRVFLRFGWKVTIKNGIRTAQAFDLTVQFLDRNGFVIDTARVYRQAIAAYDERTITGDALVSMPGALSVAKVKAIATRKK
jgi:hypothetical protein